MSRSVPKRPDHRPAEGLRHPHSQRECSQCGDYLWQHLRCIDCNQFVWCTGIARRWGGPGVKHYRCPTRP